MAFSVVVNGIDSVDNNLIHLIFSRKKKKFSSVNLDLKKGKIGH